MRLTVKERVLLHLLEFATHSDGGQVPREMTRQGIATAAWIDARHVPQNVRPLVREGLICERTSHVEGGSRRQKTYALTEAGISEAARLRDSLKNESLQVRDGDAVRSSTVSEILRRTGGKGSLLDLARRSMVEGALDISSWVPSPATQGPGGRAGDLVEMLRQAPRVEGFVGRSRELQAVTSDDGSAFVVVQGVAGIGKSWLAAKTCELLRGRTNLVWHRVRPWDTPQSILAVVGDFLDALGRPTLRSMIARGDGALARRIVQDDLREMKAFLVFDDAHEASPEVLGLLRYLKDIVTTATHVRVLVLTRRSLPLYDRRDVALRRTVRELDLQGLDDGETGSLLVPDAESLALLNLSRKLGGHPLLIELAKAAGHPATVGEYLRDARRFLEEEVYQELSAPERRMMKLAALYQTPVPREALFADAELTYDVLVSLQGRALIRRVGDDAFEVHDTIRDYFDSILDDRERGELGGFALDRLRALASHANGAGDYPSLIDYLSNALQLPASDERRIQLLETLGDAHQWIGDLLEALTAYKEAVTRTGDPETLARLHRKAAEALQVRGDKKPAYFEVERGLGALGTRPSVERGWLELIGAYVDPSVQRDGDQPLPPIRHAIDVFSEFGERRGETKALLSLGMALIHRSPSDLSEGERLLTTAVERATSLSDQRLISEAHIDLVHFYLFHSPNVEKMLEHLAVAESSARGQDSATRLDALYWKTLAQTELLADFGEAEANLKEVAVLARRTYDAEKGHLARYQLANLAYYRGDIAEARHRHEALWQESKASQWFQFKWATHSLTTAAICCVLQGDRTGFDRLALESAAPGVTERLTTRDVVVDVLLGLAAFIDGDEREFESRFARGLATAEGAFRSREAPFQFWPFLVPYFYGIVLTAEGREAGAAPFLSRALEVLRTYEMKARLEALLRDRDRLVQVLRAWALRERAGVGIPSTLPEVWSFHLTNDVVRPHPGKGRNGDAGI